MRRFLVIDDSTTVRMSIVRALQRAERDARILEASNGRDAMALFMENDVRIVFLDMVLESATTSLDLGRAMLAARPDARLILVTGLGREAPEVVDLISAGAFAYARKPVREQDIRTILQDLAAEEGNVGRIR